MKRLITPARVGVVLIAVALAATALWAVAGRHEMARSKIVAAVPVASPASARVAAVSAPAPATKSTDCGNDACPACSAPPKSSVAAAAPHRVTSVPGKGAGMVVAIDPESGQLTAPTAEQAAALRALGTSAAKAGSGVEVFQKADGSVIAIDRSGLFQQYSVVSIGADGKLHATCAQGPVQALDVLHKPAPAPPLPAAEEK